MGTGYVADTGLKSLAPVIQVAETIRCKPLSIIRMTLVFKGMNFFFFLPDVL